MGGGGRYFSFLERVRYFLERIRYFIGGQDIAGSILFLDLQTFLGLQKSLSTHFSYRLNYIPAAALGPVKAYVIIVGYYFCSLHTIKPT